MFASVARATGERWRQTGGAARLSQGRRLPFPRPRRHLLAINVNRVILTGNLTRDPELRNTPGGTAVCNMRVAVNGRRKDESGQWVDKPNYFDVVVFGAQGENANTYLAKGRGVAVDGRLNWREWEAKDGTKRQAVDVIAESVQFLSGPEDRPQQEAQAPAASDSEIPF